MTPVRASESLTARQKIALRCLLVILALLLPLLVMEFALRIAHVPVTSFDDRSFRQSAWSLRPFSSSDSYAGVPININNLGMRGPNTVIAKPPGIFRIIGVGDSITFGYGVPYDRTFLHVVETLINRRENNRDKAPLRYEVLNAGIPATGLEYYTHFIEDIAPAMEPDLIVVCMALNDIDPDLDPEPKEPHSRVSFGRLVNGYVLSHSVLYNFYYARTKSLLFRLDILKLKDNEGFGFLALDQPSALQDTARQGVKRYLARIAAFTRSRHQRLAIVVFPVEPQLSERALQLYRRRLHLYLSADSIEGQPQRWIKEMGTEMNVPVLDLLPAMRAAGDGELFLRNQSINVDPVHPSSLGHRVAGQAIARWLIDAGLLTAESFIPAHR